MSGIPATGGTLFGLLVKVVSISPSFVKVNITPFVISKQSVGWYSEIMWLFCVSTSFCPVGLASLADPGLNQLVQWWLQRESFAKATFPSTCITWHSSVQKSIASSPLKVSLWTHGFFFSQVSLFFDAQVIPNLSGGDPFWVRECPHVFLWHIVISFGVPPCFLAK